MIVNIGSLDVGVYDDVLLTADNVKGTLSYDLGGAHATASLSVDKTLSNSLLTLKATYKQKGDTFLLDEVCVWW